MERESLGQHFIIDLKSVSFEILNNITYLYSVLSTACLKHNMTILGSVRHQFDPQGVSIVLLLAESHASIHTWPEKGKVCVDIYSCNLETPLGDIAKELAESLGVQSTDYTIQAIERII